MNAKLAKKAKRDQKAKKKKIKDNARKEE